MLVVGQNGNQLSPSSFPTTPPGDDLTKEDTMRWMLILSLSWLCIAGCQKDPADDDTGLPVECDNACEGDFIIQQVQDVAEVEGCDCILGTLHVGGTIEELSLPGLLYTDFLSVSNSLVPSLTLNLPALATVGMGIVVEGNEGLRTIDGLDSLETIGIGGLAIEANPALETFALPTLTDLPDVYIKGNGQLSSVELSGLESLRFLSCEDNPLLESLVAGPALTTADSIAVSHNPVLETLAFGSLTTLEGSLVLKDLDALTTLAGLSSLQSMGSIQLENLDALTTLAGLSSLQSVDGITLSGLSQLTTLAALSSLQSVDGITLSGLSQLTTLAELSSLDVEGSVEISNNHALTSLAGLTPQGGAESHITVNDNALLADTDIFDGVVEIANVSIRNNGQLRTLSFTNLEQAGLVSVQSNPLLEELALPSLQSVDELYIMDNPTLTTLADMPRLTTLSESVEISSCPQLATVDILGGVQNTSMSHIEIREMDALTALALPSGVETLDAIVITGNDELTQVTGLASLRYVERYPPDTPWGGDNPYSLRILDNPKLEGLVLPNLQTTDASVKLSSLPALTSVDLGSLTSVGTDLVISNTGLAELDGVSSLTTVGNYLVIGQNPCLPQATAEAFAAGLSIGGGTDLSANEGPCN